MIKNFLDADEDDSLITRQSVNEPTQTDEFEKFAAPFSKIEDDADLLELPETEAIAPPIFETEEYAAEPINLDPLIESPFDDFKQPEAHFQTANDAPPTADAASVENTEFAKTHQNAPVFQSAYQPESSAETIRKSGLAYTAAIVLFGSIIFALIIGWFADLLFGTSPWGKVGGIVLGSIVGFIQFFRATSQILKDKD
ncbi:MAG: AtpZ/AtpI family protein [Acidobacteriota bacterium]|nr:AtpZ/AtpI family protein [Acidobacteriota bacterium]